MKKLLLLFVILGGLVVVSDTLLHACGSKFLVSSRGARYQRVLASIKPTNILFYWQQDEKTKEEDRWNPDAEKMLEDIGHTVDVTFDADAFLGAAKNGDFDVLAIPLDEARKLHTEMASLSPDSAVLPILYFPTRSEYSQARREFDVVMKLPTTTPKFLAALEKARRTVSP